MALVEMCVGISCSCMPTAAGFFRGKSGSWKVWSVSAVGMMRGLLGYGKQSKASQDYEGSWQSTDPHAKRGNHYVDLEMEGNKATGITCGEQQQ